jgi:hypothetical protein
MASSLATLEGVIHGKTMELEQAPGLPDGQCVAVTVQPLPFRSLPPGEGICRSAGAWGDDPQGLDDFLVQLRHDREVGRGPLESWISC